VEKIALVEGGKWLKETCLVERELKEICIPNKVLNGDVGFTYV
jgi:hypothetical protein